MAKISFDDASKIISDLKDDGAKSSRLLHFGDHWQNSNMWIGPRPSTNDNGSSVLAEIKRGLVSKNVVKEVNNRHTAGVIGHEPDWSFTPIRPMDTDEKPSTEEQDLIDEAIAALTEFWDNRELLNLLNEAVGPLLTTGRSPVRMFVPPGLVPDSGMVTAPTLEEAFKFIHVDIPRSKLDKNSVTTIPDPERATVYTDPFTKEGIGIYSYLDEDEETKLELSYLEGELTVIITGLSDENQGQEVRVNLGGRLTLFEMRRDALITQQVRQQQALLNMAHTMMARNVVLGGFLERVILNAELPGKMETVNGEQVWVPNPLYVGAGTTNAFVGAKFTDAQGNEHIATPSIEWRDPVEVTTFVDTADSAYRAILEETHQLHALISGDATASGESRKQAMDDFRKSLQPTKAQFDSLGRWLLETSLAMAAQFSGQPGRFSTLRAMFDSKIDVGKPSSDEIDTAMSLVEKKVWSRARLQTLTGVEDPDAEDTAILADEEILEPQKGVQLERQKLNLEADKRASDGGIAARIAQAAEATEVVQ